jgi:acyl-CoA dehydrogenase
MKEMGLFGMSIPEEHGGLGLTVEEEVTVAFELGRTSPVFRSVLGTNNGIGSQGIIMFGTDDQKKRYLPGLASGKIIGSFALTEPEAGSDGVRRLSARRVPSGYVINARTFHHQRTGGRVRRLRADESIAGEGGRAPFSCRAAAGIGIASRTEDGPARTYDMICDVKVEENALLGVEGRASGPPCRSSISRLHISRSAWRCQSGSPGGEVREPAQAFGKPSRISSSSRVLADSYAKPRGKSWRSRRRANATRTRREHDATACKMFASEMIGRVADRVCRSRRRRLLRGLASSDDRDVRLFALRRNDPDSADRHRARLIRAEGLLTSSRQGDRKLTRHSRLNFIRLTCAVFSRAKRTFPRFFVVVIATAAAFESRLEPVLRGSSRDLAGFSRGNWSRRS